MAIFSLEQLTQPATREEVQASIYEVLGLLGVKTTAWGSGAVVRTMIVGVSTMLAALSQLQAFIAASGFLDLAEKAWLDLVAQHVYGELRIDATYASGTLRLHNTGGAIYLYDPGDFVAANPDTGKSYTNTVAVTLNPGDTVDVAAAALESGTGSSTATGTITALVTNSLGVEVTNLDTFVGLDSESDPALRARCRAKLGALSPNGPWDAYAYAARTAKRSTGEPVSVTRTRVLRDGYGNVTLVCASSSGGIAGTLGDLTTDLGAVDDAVTRRAEPLAVAATAATASPVATLVTYELWAHNTSGLTTEQIKTKVQSALAAFFSALPIGGALLSPGDTTGYVYLDALRAAISQAVPEIYHVTLTLPAANVALTATQVATLSHNPDLHATVHQVAPTEGAYAA